MSNPLGHRTTSSIGTQHNLVQDAKTTRHPRRDSFMFIPFHLSFYIIYYKITVPKPLYTNRANIQDDRLTSPIAVTIKSTTYKSHGIAINTFGTPRRRSGNTSVHVRAFS